VLVLSVVVVAAAAESWVGAATTGGRVGCVGIGGLMLGRVENSRIMGAAFGIIGSTFAALPKIDGAISSRMTHRVRGGGPAWAAVADAQTMQRMDAASIFVRMVVPP
jgi:hypothetical protein